MGVGGCRVGVGGGWVEGGGQLNGKVNDWEQHRDILL